MPDLPDDLRALLHERAAAAPPVPPPTPAIAARVHRRRAARAAVAVATGAAFLGGAGAIVSAAAPDARRAVQPADAPSPDVTSDDADLGRYEFCDLDHPAPAVSIGLHPTELKFDSGCYVVSAGAEVWDFDNPTDVTHDIQVGDESTGKILFAPGKVLATAPDVPTADEYETVVQPSLRRGDYWLTCAIHPQMYAQLIVR